MILYQKAMALGILSEGKQQEIQEFMMDMGMMPTVDGYSLPD